MAKDIKIEGLAELERKLRQLPKELTSKAGGPIRKGLREAAYFVRDEAKSRAPSDTGRLRRNIVARLNSNPEKNGGYSELYNVGVRVQGKADDPKNSFYWRFVEFGRGPVDLLSKRSRSLFGPIGNYYQFLGKQVKGQKAQPFLGPALEENESKVLKIFMERAGRETEKLARKIGRRP